MTGLEWLARNLHNPWVEAADWAGTFFVFTFYIADLIRAASVKGTRQRYIAATITRSTGIPAAVAYLFSGVRAAAQADWLFFILDILLVVYTYRVWRRSKDDDNWWTGRGKKIWNSIKSRLTIRVLTPALIPR